MGEIMHRSSFFFLLVGQLLFWMLLRQSGCCEHPRNRIGFKQNEKMIVWKKLWIKLVSACSLRCNPNRDWNREKNICLRWPYCHSGKSTAASSDYFHHCSDFTPPSPSLWINQREVPSGCLSFCPSIRLPVWLQQPQMEGMAISARPDCP